MFIGRIIGDKSKNNRAKFIEYLDNIPDTDDGIPTLIVGKKFAEDTFGKANVHIIDRCIKDNVYWCYSKREKVSDYEKRTSEFLDKILYDSIRRIKYEFFSVLTNRQSRVRALLRYLLSDAHKIIYVTKNHVYMYCGNGMVVGFSLNETRYIGLSDDKIKQLLLDSKNCAIFEDDSFIPYEMKSKIENNLFVVPYLYSFF